MLAAKTVYYPATAVAAFLAAASYTIGSPAAVANEQAITSSYYSVVDSGAAHPASFLDATAVKPEGLFHFIAS